MKHDNRDLESWNVLLKAEIGISCYENIEFFLGVLEQNPIRQPAPTHLLNRRAVMTGQSAADSPVETFVDQHAHRSDCFEHFEFAGFDYRYDLLAFDGGKGIKEIFDRLAAFEIVDEVL